MFDNFREKFLLAQRCGFDRGDVCCVESYQRAGDILAIHLRPPNSLRASIAGAAAAAEDVAAALTLIFGAAA